MNTEPIYVTKSDGKKEFFDTKKLEFSLKRAGASTKEVEEILSTLSETMKDGITTHEIYTHAFALLHRDNRPTAIKYSIKRAVMDLGPSGFPFEDFIAEIFKYKGYEAITGQIVRGFCVEHEVDVVAWNEKKLIMVEAKFHNQLGIRSDLKIALYVKARFDDLRQMKFKYGAKQGGAERDLDEGWLVTNTKFTSTAIEYGSCQGGLVMIGWNYPPHGNLHDMILEAKLHPLTCLTALDGIHKKLLLDKGVVLCKTITENPDLLASIGVDDETSKRVIDEIATL
ncbi:MAG: ATP cone domain-containing protein [Patescibacteria group bacterium]